MVESSLDSRFAIHASEFACSRARMPQAALAETLRMYADPAGSTGSATIWRSAANLGMDVHIHLDTSSRRTPSGLRK